MLREGPIPVVVHGVLEYLVGVLLVAAPFLFGFVSGAAIACSIVLGVALICIAATTRGPTSLVDQIPVALHVTLDVLLAAALMATPFLFGFSRESAPRNLFLVLGVVQLVLTIGTRFRVPARTTG